MTHDLGWRLVEKPMVDSLFALIELFPLYYGSGVMRRMAKCVHLCFRRVSTSLYSNFTWTGSYRINQKTKDTRLSEVKTASVCVPSFWHNTGVWRTDRRTDGFAVAYIALAKLALRRAVKTSTFTDDTPDGLETMTTDEIEASSVFSSQSAEWKFEANMDFARRFWLFSE